MAHLAEKTHLDRATLSRVHSTIVFGVIGAGVAACAVAAIWFDAVNLLADW